MKIASALRSELKDRNSRAKLVAGWTGANERTVKNWISGRYAPCVRGQPLFVPEKPTQRDSYLQMLVALGSRRKITSVAQHSAPQLRQFIKAVETIDERFDGSHAIGLVPFTARTRADRDHINR
jgi:hypothetical protein